MSGAVHEAAARIAELENAPVSAHPEVLDTVHRALVAELEALSGAGTPRRSSSA